MDLKELILKRKSIRKYDFTQLDESILKQIEKFIKTQKSPFEGQWSFKIVNKEEYDKKSSGLFKISAPYYLLFFGEKTDSSLRNIGYIGELACLKLTEMNIGTCWLGGAKYKEKENGLDYIISISFGTPKEEFRKDIKDFKRKSVKDIAYLCTKEQEQMLDYVRLAPSAMNLQPWTFDCKENKIYVLKQKTPLSGMKHVQEMQTLDIGIAISHFVPQPDKVVIEPEGKPAHYICTLVFKQKD